MKKSISLKPYNTFGVDVIAKNFSIACNENDIFEFINIHSKNNPLVLGGGSNILFKKNIERPILKINIKGINIIDEKINHVFVSVGAGENWNDFVEWSLKNDFGGVENLTLIPGNVGSAPIQNIGAYGVELDSVFESCNAISIKENKLKKFKKKDCKFSYRSSIFKSNLKDKYVITNVTFKLSKKNHSINAEYKSLKSLIDKRNIQKPTIQIISNLVKEIRTKKLPDPKIIGNCGSFFKNPIINKLNFEKIYSTNNSVPFYKISKNEYKIPAAWLIEKCNMKGFKSGQVATHKEHALVIINLGEATGLEIFNFSKSIKNIVLKKFNILLEEEVNIID